MGLAASQARLLSLTARIHDVEYQAQMIQSAKLKLALQEDEVYRKYNEALDATTLTFKQTDGTRVKATFNNLCGEGSIKNGMAGNKNYIFRDGSGNVIVPSDIYEGYAKFGGAGDAYAFAMFMMTGCSEDLFNNEETGYNSHLSTYFTDISANDKVGDQIKSLRNTIDSQIEKLYGLHDDYTNGNDAVTIEDLKEAVYSGRWIDLVHHLGDENGELAKSVDESIETLKGSFDKYQYLLFRGGGAEHIYNELTDGTGVEEFDQQKFNYYLRWGKQMELDNVRVEDNKLYGATKAADYGEGDIENDPELLNEMLLSGRIYIDMVYIDNKTGNLSDEPTSAASDSVLEDTTGYDKAAIKKAEAEYEHAMKQIDKKDKQYDMDLNKLETERSALTTEYDSVKKVIQDNIERTFGIFS